MSANVSSDDSGGYPSSAASFAAGLDFSNLDLASFVPAACLLPDADFHDKLLFSTLAPLAAVALLWMPSIKGCITATRSTTAERTATRWSTFVLEFVVSSVATNVVQTFRCTEFEDGRYLTAELVLKCDGSPKQNLYIYYAWVMVLLFPIGKPPHTSWRHCCTSINSISISHRRCPSCDFLRHVYSPKGKVK